MERIDAINRYTEAFRGFPQEEFFRLYIDCDAQYLGANAFDRDHEDGRVHYFGEPGYRAGMDAGFALVRETIGEPVDLKFIEKLHNACTYGVKKVAFHFNGSGCFGNQIEMPLPQGSKRDFFDNMFCGFDAAEEIMNSLCTVYYETLEQATCDDEKLAAIVTLCSTLRESQFFQDGNRRLFVFALLDKLLVENGFSPAILAKPELFKSSVGVTTLVIAVKDGIERFNRYKVAA